MTIPPRRGRRIRQHPICLEHKGSRNLSRAISPAVPTRHNLSLVAECTTAQFLNRWLVCDNGFLSNARTPALGLDRSKVFVVHGRDDEAKNEVAGSSSEWV